MPYKVMIFQNIVSLLEPPLVLIQANQIYHVKIIQFFQILHLQLQLFFYFQLLNQLQIHQFYQIFYFQFYLSLQIQDFMNTIHHLVHFILNMECYNQICIFHFNLLYFIHWLFLSIILICMLHQVLFILQKEIYQFLTKI